MTRSTDTETSYPSMGKEELFDTSIIDDEHVSALIESFTIGELEQTIRNRTITQTSEDASNVLELIASVTQNNELADKIGTITSHMVGDRQSVLDAGDHVEEILGCRPFDLSVTEPDNEFQDPMVSISVDDTYLTRNAELNSELLSYACRIRAETGQGQQRLFEKWCDAVSEDAVREFKQSRDDPEALNFVIPDEIPATGGVDGRTPITKIPYIGTATAEDIHPTGGIMSIEDYVNLSPKQHSVIELPLAETDYYAEQKESFYKMLEGFLDLLPNDADTPEIIGYAMGWMDRSGIDGSNMYWIDDKKVMGVTRTNEILLPNKDRSVTVPNEDCKQVEHVEEKMMQVGRGEKEKVIELRGNGTETVFLDPNIWRVFSLLAKHSDSEVYFNIERETPVFTKFDTDQLLVVAPRS